MFSIKNIIRAICAYCTRKTIFIFLGIISLYLFTRLWNILALPAFVDEGIYINWAKLAAYDRQWSFISLLDGKQPLQTWGTLVLIRLLPYHALLAGRLFAVGTGFIALVGCVVTAGYLWGKKASYLAGILYVICPYFIFYDKIALVDSGVNAAYIWITFITVLLMRTGRLDVALTYGLVAGIGWLTKSSVALFIALGSSLVLVVKRSRAIDYFVLWGIGTCIAFSLYNVQLFSPWYYNVGQKNLTFILSISEFLRDPLQLVMHNIRIVPLYIAWESGWVPVIYGLVGLVWLWRKDKQVAFFHTILIIIPLILILFFNKVVFPRYLIFFAGSFVLLSTYVLIHIPQRYRVFFMVLYCLVQVIQGGLLVYNPIYASLPPVDVGQYIKGKTAVWGAKELMHIVRTHETSDFTRRPLILAEGDFGLVADVLRIYSNPGDTTEIRGLWPLKDEHIWQAATGEAHVRPVFAVFPHRNDFPLDWPVRLVRTWSKPGVQNPEKLYLFQVKPQP